MEQLPALRSGWTAEHTIAQRRPPLLGVQALESRRFGHAVQPVPEGLLESSLEMSRNLHLLAVGRPSGMQHGEPEAMAGPHAEAPVVLQPSSMQQAEPQAVSKAGGRSLSSNTQPGRPTAAMHASQMTGAPPGLPLQPVTKHIR